MLCSPGLVCKSHWVKWGTTPGSGVISGKGKEELKGLLGGSINEVDRNGGQVRASGVIPVLPTKVDLVKEGARVFECTT